MLTDEERKAIALDENQTAYFIQHVAIPNLREVIRKLVWNNLFNATSALSFLECNTNFEWKADSPQAQSLLPVLAEAVARCEAAEEGLIDEERVEAATLDSYLHMFSQDAGA